MNKRSKSSTNVQLLHQQLANKTVEYDHLLDKVTRSKPILETIYSKVKLRESLYEKKIQNSKKQIAETKELVKDYKKLFEDGLRIMEKSKMLDKKRYDGNYLKGIEKIKNKSIYEQYKERIN